MAGQIRRVAGLEYELVRKNVKNLNLRVRRDGSVAVSVPRRVSADQADAFVAGRLGWVIEAKQQMARAARRQAECPPPSPEECLALFRPVSDRVYPAFAGVLGGQPPQLRVRDMSSRWGVCHPAKRQITLALRLYREPPAAQIYVVVHEYCHFLVAGHGPAFWQAVARLLPDWKARRALLSDRANR